MIGQSFASSVSVFLKSQRNATLFHDASKVDFRSKNGVLLKAVGKRVLCAGKNVTLPNTRNDDPEINRVQQCGG